jgi:hypothetical protein
MPLDPRTCGFRNCKDTFRPSRPSQIYCCLQHQQAEQVARYRDKHPKANAIAVRKYQDSVGTRNP